MVQVCLYLTHPQPPFLSLTSPTFLCPVYPTGPHHTFPMSSMSYWAPPHLSRVQYVQKGPNTPFLCPICPTGLHHTFPVSSMSYRAPPHLYCVQYVLHGPQHISCVQYVLEGPTTPFPCPVCPRGLHHTFPVSSMSYRAHTFQCVQYVLQGPTTTWDYVNQRV